MKKKKLLSLALAAAMLFGSAALLPEDTFSFGSNITASAEVEGDYEYTVLDDGTVEIKRYNGKETTLVIPSTLNGKKVSSIGRNAFYDCGFLVSVSIPDGVEQLPDYVFSNCRELKR